MSHKMIIPTRIAKELFSPADLVQILRIDREMVDPLSRSKKPSIFIPQIMRPKDGWCSDSLSFLFSYRIYLAIFMSFQGKVPDMEFEWQLISSEKAEAFSSRQLLTLKTSHENPDALHGGFIIAIEPIDCQLPSGQLALNAGECLFISQEDIVDLNVEFQGKKFILGAIWQRHPKNYPWLFQFED